jgi:hypothetical protein
MSRSVLTVSASFGGKDKLFCGKRYDTNGGLRAKKSRRRGEECSSIHGGVWLSDDRSARPSERMNTVKVARLYC